MLAAIPLVALAAAIALQLLLAGYALTLADGAAEAGALALAAGRPARSAAEDSLPAWAAKRAQVTVHGGEVTVRVAPPGLLSALASGLEMTSKSYARPSGR